MRPRAAAVIQEEGRIVLIERKKGSHQYFVLPGGSIKPKEAAIVACKREVLEETGLEIGVVSLMAKIQNKGRDEYYFRAKRIRGRLHLGEPELSRHSEENGYFPTWVAIDLIENLNIQPPVVKSLIEDSAGIQSSR